MLRCPFTTWLLTPQHRGATVASPTPEEPSCQPSPTDLSHLSDAVDQPHGMYPAWSSLSFEFVVSCRACLGSTRISERTLHRRRSALPASHVGHDIPPLTGSMTSHLLRPRLLLAKPRFRSTVEFQSLKPVLVQWTCGLYSHLNRRQIYSSNLSSPHVPTRALNLMQSVFAAFSGIWSLNGTPSIRTLHRCDQGKVRHTRCVRLAHLWRWILADENVSNQYTLHPRTNSALKSTFNFIGYVTTLSNCRFPRSIPGRVLHKPRLERFCFSQTTRRAKRAPTRARCVFVVSALPSHGSRLMWGTAMPFFAYGVLVSRRLCRNVPFGSPAC
jgi:hypothetical protein